MVCLGNICRSPLAEGIMAEKLRNAGIDARVDSAGTGGWHIGQSPDKRSIQIALRHGIDISAQQARKVEPEDLSTFDFIFAMDQQNYRDLMEMAAGGPEQNKVQLILEYAGMGTNDIPDPWYGDQQDFSHVFNLLNEACTKVLQKIANQHINKKQEDSNCTFAALKKTLTLRFS